MRKVKVATVKGSTSIIVALVLCGICSVAMIVYGIYMSYTTPKEDRIAFNNGVCSECGGKLQFYQGVGAANKTYIYKCEDCGYAVELHSMQ